MITLTISLDNCLTETKRKLFIVGESSKEETGKHLRATDVEDVVMANFIEEAVLDIASFIPHATITNIDTAEINIQLESRDMRYDDNIPENKDDTEYRLRTNIFQFIVCHALARYCEDTLPSIASTYEQRTNDIRDRLIRIANQRKQYVQRRARPLL